LWDLAAHFSRLVERHAGGEYARAKPLPEESRFGRSQTLKSDRLRQPADVLESFVEVDPGSPLRVGLRVDVHIELAQRENVLVIPLRAVEFQQGVATVRVRTSSGIQSRKVQLGAQDGLNIEVAEGLNEGEELVY
jgi:multidrug efflux pump subunit AcrA (membrane-fusion protein)